MSEATFKDLNTGTVPIIDISTSVNFIQQIHLKLLQQHQIITLFEKMCNDLLLVDSNKEIKQIMQKYKLLNESTEIPDNVLPIVPTDKK